MELRTRNGEILKFLIDTGANKNYIKPKHARISRRLEKSAKVQTVNGTFAIDKFLFFNPFPKSKFVAKSEFFIFDFNNFFDGLLGYEFLQKSEAIIDAATNTLHFPDISVPLKKKFPTTKKMQAGETKFLKMSFDQKDGDFMIAEDIEIQSSVYLNAGIYHIENQNAFVAISNLSSKNVDVMQPDIVVDLNNFETEGSNDVPHHSIKKSLFENLRTNHLNEEEKKALFNVIANNQNCFHLDDQHLSCTNVGEHAVHTKDDVPVHVKTYRYPFCHKEEVGSQIRKMLDQKIIRPSNSPWSSPIWVVPKKKDASGKKKWRLVIDYRKLNEKTIDDRYPIPNITEILDKMGKCVYFSTLDLASGFYQIPLREEDRKKTAFSVDNGHYEFTRMPMGLKNAPATFQRVMDHILRNFIGKICVVYLDDILVFSSSLQEHTESLQKILSTLDNFNLKIQIDKSEFLRKDVEYLGHVITAEGVKPNPDKIKAIEQWPLPKNEKDLRGFLGTLSYYRRFIRDLAKISKPLSNQLRKGQTISHTKSFVEAFECCKKILTSSDVLQYPDFTKPFVLTTDASNFAIGAVLSQGPIGRDKPVAFASRTLTKTEENYSTIEKELLAVVWACKHFRAYLFGRKFTLFTDHQPLIYIFNMKDPSSKLVRWRLYLEEFDFEIKYRKGSQNTVADGLSRIKIDNHAHNLEGSLENASLINNADDAQDDETVHSADTDDSHFVKMTMNAVNSFSNQILLSKSIDTSTSISQIFPKVIRISVQRPTFSKNDILNIFKNHLDYKKVNCIHCPEEIIPVIQSVYHDFFCRNRHLKIVISQRFLRDVTTPEEENELIEKTHNRAHRGIQENLEVLKREFFFPKMKNKIRKFINLCTSCKEAKYDRKPYKITFAQIPIPKKPFEIIHVDIFISAPNLFLSVVDKFSRFGILISIKSRSIPDVRKGLVKLFATHKQPSLIVSDNEPALKSVEVRGLLESLNIQTYYSPVNHSEVNGIVERFHSTIAEIFRCIKSQHENLSPKELFQLAVSHYNNTIHTSHNMKPVEVFFGVKDGVSQPSDLNEVMRNKEKFYDEIILALEKKQKQNHDFHNKNREEEPKLSENETVFVARQGVKSKVKPKFQAVKVSTDNTKTFTDDKNRKIHKESIKRRPN